MIFSFLAPYFLISANNTKKKKTQVNKKSKKFVRIVRIFEIFFKKMRGDLVFGFLDSRDLDCFGKSTICLAMTIRGANLAFDSHFLRFAILHIFLKPFGYFASNRIF